MIAQIKNISDRCFTGRNTLWLAIAPMVLAFVDLYITFAYQPTAYWLGQYSVAVEGNPIALMVMWIHPLMLVACVMIWCIGVSFLIVHLPRRWALDLASVLIIGHTITVCAWFVLNESAWWAPTSFMIVIGGGLVGLMQHLRACGEPSTEDK